MRKTTSNDSEARYRGLLEAAPDAMVVVNAAGEIVLLNVQAENRFGYRRDELVGQQITTIIPQGFAERLLADGTRSAAEALAQQIGTGIELSALRKDGSEFAIEIMLSPLESADGILVTAAIRDITARKAAEQNLVQMEARYRGLLEAAPDAMVVVDEDGDIVLVNFQAQKQFGYRRDELLGQKVTNIIPHGFAERLHADAERSEKDALAQEIGTGVELSALRKDGSEFPIEIMLSPLTSGDEMLVTAAIRDISTRKRAEVRLQKKIAEIAHAAKHDSLTGLPNRVLLLDRIDFAISFAARHRTKLAVLYMDLDGFKRVNDLLGHSTGDRLLISIAGRLEQSVRGTDTVSRQGGDEFVVLLTEVKRAKDAAVSANRILRSVGEVHRVDEHNLHVSASVGISIYPDDGEDAEALIKNADTAMYQAKDMGRQTYQFFKPIMNARAVECQSIQADLRRALERQELELHYQPKIDLTTGLTSGAEALVRWQHPSRGLIPPAQFIPIAEDCRLILPIGEWVLGEACRQAQRWAAARLSFGTMAVNVSAVQFRELDFAQRVFAILSETGMDPKRLELELTESVLMTGADSIASTLQTLRRKGVQVALDDFGTGYSSLSYLQRFPVDCLKIDQSFIRQISAVGAERTLVTAIINMAHALELRIVAEGVETREELQFVKDRGCDEGQGYYFSRPLTSSGFAEHLAEQDRTMAASCSPPVQNCSQGHSTQSFATSPKGARAGKAKLRAEQGLATRQGR